MLEKPFTMNQTWLECISCGHRVDLLEERIFECPKCGDLFDVRHDFKKKKPGEWMNIFDGRKELKSLVTNPLYTSGVWRFWEWIMPYLPDNLLVSRYEGNGPIIPAGPKLSKWIGKGIEVWIIKEGENPSGSFKDQGMTVLASIAKAAKAELTICASTGDTSASAALYSAIAGIPCAVLLPGDKASQVTTVQLYQPQLHGAKVIILPGVFNDAMDVVAELPKHFNVYLANSKNSTRIEGHQSTIFLLAQAFAWQLPEVIAAPIGNGSNLSSLGKGIAIMASHGFESNTMLLGCQVEGVNPIAGAWERLDKRFPNTSEWLGEYKPIPKEKLAETASKAARIGDPVSKKKVMRSVVDTKGVMVTVSEENQNEAVGIAGLDGDNLCPQTGMALAGVKEAYEKGYIEKGQTVAVVSTATGLKFPGVVKYDNAIVKAKECSVGAVADILGLT